MKKILLPIITLILMLTLVSCGDVGNPTITYIDYDGTEKSQVIHSSSDEEYIGKVIDLLDRIKPTKYSYFISTQANASLKISSNNINTSYSFFSGDEIIYDSTENLTLNNIYTQNNLSINDNVDTAKSILKKYEEYIYPTITYVYENDNTYSKKDNTLQSNAFYDLKFDLIFNCLNKSFIKDYELIIFDVTKTSIIFSLNYGLLTNQVETYNYPTSLYFSVDPSNGLIKSIELINSNYALDKYKSFSNNDYLIEDITFINSIINVNIIYNDIPNIKLSNEEISKF